MLLPVIWTPRETAGSSSSRASRSVRRILTAVALAEQIFMGPTVPRPRRTLMSSAGGPWSISIATMDFHTAFRTTSSRSRDGMNAVSRAGLMRQTSVCSDHRAGPVMLRPVAP